MYSYYSKNEFIDLLFLYEALERNASIIQIDSSSCLSKKNKSTFQSNAYLEPVLDLHNNDLVLLQLPGYKVDKNTELHTYIKNAVNKVGRLLSKQLSVIKNHTSHLALIEPISKTSRNVISSTTFYDYPFCTFFTRYGLFFIPPNTLFFEPCDYAIFDNIYHEALHQKLLIQILLDKIFLNYNLIPKNEIIPIPWRNKEWSIEHALQAFYVYRHLYFSRLIYCQSTQDIQIVEKMESAIYASKSNSEYLYLQLMKHKTLFTKNGLNLLEELMIEVESSSLSLTSS